MNFRRLSALDIEGFEGRSKRHVSETACPVFKYGGTSSENLSDVSEGIYSIPGIHETIGDIMASVAMLNHFLKGRMNMANTALGCDYMPFEDVKSLTAERISALNRELNKEVQTLSKVSKMVSRTLYKLEITRNEMVREFNRVIHNIKNKEVRELVTQIHNFDEWFTDEKKKLNSLSINEYIKKLEDETGMLYFLKESKTPTQDSLHQAIFEIVSNNFASPKHLKDEMAFQALYAVLYGTQTYATIFCFLMESHSYITDYYYQMGDYEKFNKRFDILVNVFDAFKDILVGKSNGVFVKIGDTIKNIRNEKFADKIANDLYMQVTNLMPLIHKIETEIRNMILPVIKEIPPKLIIGQDSGITSMDDKHGSSIKFAVQYEKNGIYSKLSEWTAPIERNCNLNCLIKTATDAEARNRLIFRQINNEKPVLVGILDNKTYVLKEINRYFYDIVGETERLNSNSVFEVFSEHTINFNAIFELGRTTLHNIAKSGNVYALEYMKSFGPLKTNVKDRKGYTPLHVAVENERSHIINELIAAGADVNAITYEDGFTPLHIAAQKGFKEVAEILVKNSATDLNKKDKNGFTPLHHALSSENPVFRLLFNRDDVDVDIRSSAGLTLAHLLVMKNDPKALLDLFSHREIQMNSSDSSMSPLHYAAMMGFTDIIKLLLEIDDIDVNLVSNYILWTPLHYAIFFRKEDSAIELIKHAETNVNLPDFANNTLLHIAAGTGQLNVVKELLNKNVYLEDKTTHGYTPLHLAAVNGSKDIIEALVEKGANVYEIINLRLTPLKLSLAFGSKDLQEYLKLKTGLGIRRHVNYRSSDVKFTANSSPKINFLPPLKDKKLDYVKVFPFENNSERNFATLLENSNSFKRSAESINTNTFNNGTLLLLDVLIRKLTQGKYVAFNETGNEIEVNAKALTIMETFEKLLNSFNNVPTGEEIDLFEVYSEMKRVLRSGRGADKVIQVLEYYVEMLPFLNTEDKIKILERLSAENK